MNKGSRDAGDVVADIMGYLMVGIFSGLLILNLTKCTPDLTEKYINTCMESCKSNEGLERIDFTSNECVCNNNGHFKFVEKDIE